MNKEDLKKYANLLVRAGGNVQKGQVVTIGSDVRDAEFASLVVECAYDAGASDVVILWDDEVTTRTRYLRADNAVFDVYPQWAVDRFKDFDSRGAVHLRIASSNPDALAGVDVDRIMRQNKVARAATKEHSTLFMNNTLRWSIIAVPSPHWAKKVFPDLPLDEAIEKLGIALLKVSRADGDDPVKAWEEHQKTFAKRLNYLNEQQFSALRITTGLGTNLTLGLIKNHIWAGGSNTDKNGIAYFPNIPTEEVFTMPDRNRADGKVVASMPLAYQGNLIENIVIDFKDGKAISHDASKNKEILTSLLGTDEGATRLGEMAIVSNSSPISQLGTIFYHTLFDENASAHLALGKAYPFNLENGVNMSADELSKAGVNDSLIHVDFMFGTSDMNIVGIKEDGTEILFFEAGEFAI